MDAAINTAPAPTEAAAPVVDTPIAEPRQSRSPLGDLTPDERHAWERDGALPKGRLSWRETPAQEPSQPAAAPAETEDAPAQDATGRPILEDGKPISKRQHAANERIRQAVERGIAEARKRDEQRIADLEAQIHGRQPATPASESAAPTGPAKPRMADFEARIGVAGGFESYAAAVEAFQDARDTWREEVAAQDAAQRQAMEAKTAAERAIADVVQGHTQREQAILEAHPDYHTKTRSLREALDVDQPLTQALLKLPHSADVLLHLAEHTDELQRIGALGLTDLPAACVALGKLDAQYETRAHATAAPVLPKKHVTSATEPPITLGTRPAEPADAAKAAVARGSLHDYDAEMTRRDLARLGRR